MQTYYCSYFSCAPSLPSPLLPVCVCVCERFSERSVTHSNAKRLDTFSPPLPASFSPYLTLSVAVSARGRKNCRFSCTFSLLPSLCFFFCSVPPPSPQTAHLHPHCPLFFPLRRCLLITPPPQQQLFLSACSVSFRHPSHIVSPLIFTLHPVACLPWPSDLCFRFCFPLVLLSPVTAFSVSVCVCVWVGSRQAQSSSTLCFVSVAHRVHVWRCSAWSGLLVFFLVLSFIFYVDLGLIHFCSGLLSFIFLGALVAFIFCWLCFVHLVI